jgi:hypothetical protein
VVAAHGSSALEGIDNGGKALAATLRPEPLTRSVEELYEQNLLGGVGVIETQGLTFIPYYAWANRGPGEMAVWIRTATKAP